MAVIVRRAYDIIRINLPIQAMYKRVMPTSRLYFSVDNRKIPVQKLYPGVLCGQSWSVYMPFLAHAQYRGGEELFPVDIILLGKTTVSVSNERWHVKYEGYQLMTIVNLILGRFDNFDPTLGRWRGITPRPLLRICRSSCFMVIARADLWARYG